ncbi:MAG: hydroxyacid dehydrogenase [Polaromonas sp.]|nr:hydroxyacid dehydrogenase [Polaromonas sp.]
MTTVFVSHPQSKLAHYFGDRAIAALKTVADVRLNPGDTDLSSSELAALAGDCEVIISYRQTVGDEAQASAGFIASVSEWIVGVMIDLSRHISATTANYHAGRPVAATMGRELRGATLGVIGFGQISRYLCDVALALGMRIVVHDPYTPTGRKELEQVELLPLLQRSDYVVCLAAATEATENMMNAATFGAMKPGAFFINASRGNLVDEDALLAALDAGAIAGCAVDVGRAPDQMPSPRVAAHPRVIASPHIGGLTPPAVEHQAMETVAQVAELLQGRAPKGAVNAPQATRWQQATKAPEAA